MQARSHHGPFRACLLLLLPLLLPWSETQAGDEVRLDVTRHVLKNGMRLLLVPRTEAPVVATYMRFGVGGVDDPKGQTGIAHLLEHMMFKGTTDFGTTNYAAELPLMKRLDELWATLDAERAKAHSNFDQVDPEKVAALEAEIERTISEQKQYVVKNELSQAYQRLGGVGLNASTGNDSTQYYVQLPSNQLEVWAKLESDRIRKPVFREFYSERDVVHEERRLRTESQPRGQFQETFGETAYSAHPYRQPVVGWSSDIDSTVRSEVLAYFKTFYAPNNCVVALVGDIDVKAATELVEKYFGDIPAAAPPRRNITIEPPQKGQRQISMMLDSAPSLTLGWHIPAKGHAESYALTVAGQILSGSGGGGFRGRGRRGGGGGGSGRFARELVRGQQVALNARASGRPSLYPSLFTVSATPAEGVSLEELKTAVLAEVARLAEEPPTDEELARVRNAIEASAIRSLTSNTGIARSIAEAEATAGDWHYIETERERLRAVTAADVARVVRSYLIDSNLTVGLLHGKTEDPPRGSRRGDGPGRDRRPEGGDR